MRIALTGVSGQVGAHLRAALSGHEVIALNRAQFDLTKPETLAAKLLEIAPQVCINPAAYTAVDSAETAPDVAYAVNRDAVAEIAKACRSLGAPLVHFSTDYVFDGSASRPWLETDTPAPISVYGASKLAGEAAIAASGCDAIILRTSWVYARTGKNFLLTMQRLAAEKEFLRVVADQHGTPNAAGILAHAVVHAINFGVEGLRERLSTYHLTAHGETTWHGFASAIVAAGPRQIPVHAISSAEFPTPAKRPTYSVMNGEKFERAFGFEMPHWEEGLRRCLNESAPQV